MLPTPTSRDSKGSAEGFNERRDGGLDLPGAIKLLPTPRTTDSQGAGAHGDGGMDLRTAILMGTPQSRDDVLDFGQYDSAVKIWEGLTRKAPSPTEPAPRAKNGLRLAAGFSEWMMGLPEGWVTHLITVHARAERGRITNTAAMKAIGNGVVPQQAAAALQELLEASDE